MDDYSGQLNFLALVGAALLLSVVVIGFSGHDNGQMEDVKTASIVAPAIEQARSSEPAEPLLRGDELGLQPGPEIGRLLAEIEEERAAGTIATKEEALDYARRHSGAVREDG